MATLLCSTCGNRLTVSPSGTVEFCQNCAARIGVPEAAPDAVAKGVKRGDTRNAQSYLQPNSLICVALTIVAATVFYGLGPFLLLRNTWLYHLFCGHGWVPYVATVFFFYAFWFLALKIPILRQERSFFALDLLSAEPGVTIDQAASQRILNRMARLTDRQRAGLLVSRIRQGLLRLNQLGTAEKLDDMLRYRAEADAAMLDSGYAAPRFVIWAVPVLGFVGTVLGISSGVQAFSRLLQRATSLHVLRHSLKGVTYGLGQAFQTTMLAMCMSLLLMLIMAIVQRKEDLLMSEIDDYCMDRLLARVRVS